MKIDEKQISHVSKLARLDLTEEEKQEFSTQLSDIITYVEKINEVDTSGIAAAEHVEDIHNVLRDDKIKESINLQEIEKIAPSFEDSHIVVPRIIEGGE